SGSFASDSVNATLADLEAQCRSFAASYSRTGEHSIEFAVEARYPSQVWEIELPVPMARIESASNLEALVESFHALHERIYAIADPASDVEFVTWIAKVRCPVERADRHRLVSRRRPADRPG